MNDDASKLLLADLGLANLTQEEQSAILNDFSAIVENRLSTELAERLSEAQLAHLETLADDPDDTQLVTYLQSCVPDYAELLDAVVATCRHEIVEQSQRLQQYLTELPTETTPPAVP